MKHVLIAEDDKLVAKLCRSKFEKAGFLVSIANDGERAISKLQENPPNLVLLDLSLPVIDGVGVLKYIRSNPAFSKIPVFILSNSDYFSGIVQNAWQAGATHFFNKADSDLNTIVAEADGILHDSTHTNPPVSKFTASPATTRIPVSRKQTVMIADDDKLIHGVLSFFLNQAGFEVKSVFDGRQAMETSLAKAPDLLILDSLMPVMDGKQVLDQWKLHEILSAIPVIMLSSLPPDQQVDGFEKYMTKPFSPEEIVSLVTSEISA